MIHQNGFWLPTMSPAQLKIFNNTAVYQLVSGPVMSGKTWGVLQKVVRHLFDTPGAMVAMVAKTVKSAKHGGSYGILINTIIPEWERAGIIGETPDIKFGYYDKDSTPRLAGDTRTNHFALRNRYGGKSEFFLFSMDYDEAVSEKFKNTSFSCFYFVELTNFGDNAGGYDIWRTTSNRLRMPHLTPEQHLWIADTNPSEDGVDNVWYRLFYDKHGFDPVEDRWTIDNLSVTEVMIEDNPWLTATQISKIKAENRHDPSLYARNVLGRWEARQSAGHFGDTFTFNVHVRGDTSKPNREDHEIIVPPESCTELLGGWDTGDLNNSFHLACKRPVGDTYAYDYIDRVGSIGHKVSLQDFVEAVMDRLAYWSEFVRSEYGTKAIKFKHWSDSSAFSFNAGLNGTEAKLIYTLSGGEIVLMAVDKPKGSVRKRVETWRRLMFENRIFFSAQLTQTIKMVRNLKRGSTAVEFVSEAGGFKHDFDSASYIQAGEEPMEIMSRMPRLSARRSSYIGVAA